MKTGTIFVLVAFIVGGLEVACVPTPTSNQMCLYDCLEDRDCGRGRECVERGCSRICSPQVPIALCERRCWKDWDCGARKRCIRRGCSRVCSTFPEVGICVEECQGSWDCALGHWCVNTGCGHICVPFRNIDEQKPGTCPPLPKGSFGTCVEMCRGDEFCPLGQKCCSNGCGHVCTAVQAEPYWVSRLEEDAQRSDN
ncbi:WAP four-disulfide core domain protein 3-like [Eschrichtius robustus]|uniref:WAP four-disulfide core domain protein 3-like n=1 Tax=Eschrichtius robustus TaxID=9764 RepID=UPI0035C0B9CE